MRLARQKSLTTSKTGLGKSYALQNLHPPPLAVLTRLMHKRATVVRLAGQHREESYSQRQRVFIPEGLRDRPETTDREIDA